MSEEQHILDILGIIWKKRRFLMYVVVLSGVVSIIASLVLPNYYLANTTFYAASQDLAKPSPIVAVDNNIDYYGNNQDLDRLFSIANSTVVKEFLIDSFDLYNHYGIDVNSSKAELKIHEKLSKLYGSKKTKYDALELWVEDEDPIIAAQMVNAARNKINEEAQKIIKSSQNALLKTHQENILFSEMLLARLSDSLERARDQYQLFDFTTQNEVLFASEAEIKKDISQISAKISAFSKNTNYVDSIAYLTALKSSYLGELKSLQGKMTNLNNGLNEVFNLDRQIREMNNQLNIERGRESQLKSRVEQDFSALHIIDAATTPFVKSRPQRSLIVLLAVGFSLAMAILSILLMNSLNRVDWKKHFRE